jgi:hypothetical protein
MIEFVLSTPLGVLPIPINTDSGTANVGDPGSQTPPPPTR